VNRVRWYRAGALRQVVIPILRRMRCGSVPLHAGSSPVQALDPF